MALLTGALSSYDVGWAGSTAGDGSRSGNRENVSDVLVQLSPEEHATISAIGNDTADALYWEWQTDRLAARSSAGALEGQVSTATAGTTPKTLSNNVQHFQGDFAVTNDQIEMAKRGKQIGIKDIFRYRAGQRATEKLLDVNYRAWSLAASSASETDAKSAGSTTAGPLSANFHYWARYTNSTATNAPGTSAFLGATPATQFKYTAGTFSSGDINTVTKAMWANGVVPDTMFMNQAVKIAMDASIFASNTTAGVISNIDAFKGGEYGAVVDVYRNTLGRYVVIVDRLIPTVSTTGTTANAMFADGAWYMAKRGDMSLAWWRQFQPYNVANIGDGVQGYVRGSLGFKIKNPYAIGGVYGCTDN